MEIFTDDLQIHSIHIGMDGFPVVGMDRRGEDNLFFSPPEVDDKPYSQPQLLRLHHHNVRHWLHPFRSKQQSGFDIQILPAAFPERFQVGREYRRE